MDLKIGIEADHLRALLDQLNEDNLESVRDHALLLADYIEQYVYQRDAERLVEEFIESTKEERKGRR